MLGWLSKFKRKVEDKSEVKYAVKLDCGDKFLYLMPSEENSSRYGYKFTHKARFARHCTFNRALKVAKEWARCGYAARVCELRFFNLTSKVVTDVFPSREKKEQAKT